MAQRDIEIYQRLQRQLITAQQRSALVAHHEQQVMLLQQSLEVEQERNAQLVGELAARTRNVEKVEKFSWLRLKALLVENVDEAVLRHELEAQSAVDSVTASDGELDYLRSEIKRFETAIADLGLGDGFVATAQVDLDNHVRDRHPHVANELAAIDREAARLLADLIEFTEATTAGNEALVELSALREQLVKAKRLSTWDAWFQGGTLVSIYKRSAITVSTELTRSVAHKIERFDRELSDTEVGGISLELEDALSHGLADILFNSWRIDNSVNDSIKTAQETADRVHGDVTEKLEILNVGVTAIVTQLDRADKQRIDLISRPQATG